MGVVRLACFLIFAAVATVDDPPLSVRVPLNPASEVDVSELISRLEAASRLPATRPSNSLNLPLSGRASTLSMAWLVEALGPEATLSVQPGELAISLSPRVLELAGRLDWSKRLSDLTTRTAREVERRGRYGFRTRASYRANDPTRPTICLIHGLNSTSGVFRHMDEPLEAAGYGIVTYDFPYNRDLDESSAAFARDWAEFRRKSGDSCPWSIVAHSMGSLLARAYVEDPAAFQGDVGSLILIAPPNHGSSLSKAQTFLQLIQGAQALNGSRRIDPLSLLGDGVGLAADDMSPRSAYLEALNSRKRRAGVRYHILAGDSGYLNAEARRQVEAGLGGKGVLGRMLVPGVSGSLDEITDGLGDGCVSVSSTRLDGVEDHRTLHANHLELIRAPLLFPEPGPVASMPDLLRWLREDAGVDLGRR